MKIKIFFAVVTVASLIGAPPIFSKEEPVVQPVSSGSLAGEPMAGTEAFEFSLQKGGWIEGRAGEIFSTGYHPANFVLPSLKSSPQPIRYPRWAVREGLQGRFVIAVEVLTSGEVGRWEVLESTGHSLLDEAAVNAVIHWKFYPALEGGIPVVMCIQVPVLFELKGSGEEARQSHRRLDGHTRN